MVTRCHARSETDDAKHRSIRNRCSNLLSGRIDIAVVIDWKALAGPDHAVKCARALRCNVLDRFVDQHFCAPMAIMPCDNASDIQAHRCSPGTCELQRLVDW